MENEQVSDSMNMSVNNKKKEAEETEDREKKSKLLKGTFKARV